MLKRLALLNANIPRRPEGGLWGRPGGFRHGGGTALERGASGVGAPAPPAVLVSVAMDGGRANGVSAPDALSADGRYVLFASRASNLVPGDLNGEMDLFVRDLRAGRTSMVPAAPRGAHELGLESVTGSMSADGRYVAFVTTRSSKGAFSITGRFYFTVSLYDRSTDRLAQLSATTGNARDVTDVSRPAISADGRYVAYGSASRKVSRVGDVFVYDRSTRRTTVVSVASDGTRSEGQSYDPSISADGRYISFGSSAANLVDDINVSGGVFVHDQVTHRTVQVSVTGEGAPAVDGADSASLSANGRFVTFTSRPGPLTAGLAQDEGVYLHDRLTRRTTLLPLGSPRRDGPNHVWEPSGAVLSADGSRIAYNLSNLSGPHPGNEVYVYDRRTGLTTRVSPVDLRAGRLSIVGGISADGGHVAYSSTVGDAKPQLDAFVARLCPVPAIVPSASPSAVKTDGCIG
jgi:Tol biopolymer transport system component